MLAAFCLKRAEEAAPSGARLGLAAARALGSAVERNRVRRLIREIFRLHRAEICGAWDIVVHPRRAAVKCSFAELEKAFRKVIDRCAN